MSVQQMTLVWGLDLEPNEKIVLLAYADHADDDGEHVYPSLGRIAYKTGYSEDQVRRISRKLVKDELMELVEKGQGRGKPHRYKLTLDKGSKLPPFSSKQKGGAKPSKKVASEDEKGGIAMPPEPSTENRQQEPSVSPQSETEFPPSGASDANAPSATNWFSVFCERAEDFGYEVTPDDRKELPKNLKLVSADQDEKSMKRIVLKCLEARAFRSYPVSPQRARDEVLGVLSGSRSSKQANGSLMNKQPQNATPEPAAQALAEHELKRYAYLCERFDFTSEDEPPYPVLKALGGTENEQHSNLTRMRSVARRALREAEASHVAA